MKATEEFDVQMMRVTQDRGDVYGPPEDDFRRVASMLQVLAECPDDVLRHPMAMIAVKLARLIHTPNHVDSWVDIAGYARTACMVIDARSENDATEAKEEYGEAAQGRTREQTAAVSPENERGWFQPSLRLGADVQKK